MYKEFKSCIFSMLYFVIMHYFFCRELSSKKYHYCAIFVQSLTAYATTDCSKNCLVKDDLYKRSVSQFRDTRLIVKVTRVTNL